MSATSGRPQWLRRQLWLPDAIDSIGYGRGHAPPLIRDGLVYVTQPGVPCVGCIEIDSGRLRWRGSPFELRRQIGLAGEQLIVETADGFAAFDSKTGEPAWFHEATDVLYAQAGRDGFVYAHREAVEGGASRPRLVWLDPLTGATIGDASLDGMRDPMPRFGSLTRQGGRWWALAGKGSPQTSFEIVELVATDSAAAPGKGRTFLSAR